MFIEKGNLKILNISTVEKAWELVFYVRMEISWSGEMETWPWFAYFKEIDYSEILYNICMLIKDVFVPSVVTLIIRYVCNF